MKNKFTKFGVMVDCSRNSVMTVSAVKKLIDVLSELGYNTLKLYTEDTYEIDGEPYFGYLRGRYTKSELKEIDAYAISKGMELIPCVQTLAHLNAIFRWKDYAAINDTNDILLAEDDRTYKLIDNIFKTLHETFTSRNVNIGMDEAHMLGRGAYYDKHGDVPRPEIMQKHLVKVLEIAAKYGFTCEMWSDMFLRMAYGDYYVQTKDESASVAETVPENVRLIYWDYYSTDKEHYANLIDRHRKLTNDVQFAGGAWTWTGFCPANEFSIEATKQAFTACREKNIKEVCLTMWGDNGGECSPFMALPALVTAAEYAKGNFDEDKIKKRFKKVVGMDYDLFSALETPDKFRQTTTPNYNNPSKYILYNDLFRGVFDKNLPKGENEYFKIAAERLDKGAKNKRWGYLFKSISALSKVLEIKCDLGLRTREAYEKRDKPALKALADCEYKELIKRLENFYTAFESYWMTEKKPHGFDVQDVRLGGLIRRVSHCRKMIYDYTSGKTDCIPELEERLLDFYGDGEKAEIKQTCLPNHTLTASVNVF